MHHKLLLVLTESSVKSPWVEKEVETALEKERKRGQTVLFPIRLDGCGDGNGLGVGGGFEANAAYWGFSGVEERAEWRWRAQCGDGLVDLRNGGIKPGSLHCGRDDKGGGICWVDAGFAGGGEGLKG